MSGRLRSAVQKQKQGEEVEDQEQELRPIIPPRRSTRVTSSEIKRKKDLDLQQRLSEKHEAGFEIRRLPDKGRAIFTTRSLASGEFIMEYAGDLVEGAVAKAREMQYTDEHGSFLFFFNHRNKQYCVDATTETSRLGRLINHSRLHPNMTVDVVEIGHIPIVYFKASRDIAQGEELLYDYGDRTKKSVVHNPWLITS